jgi:DNA-directed RNA polymerase subunit RPC12/RpoP
MSKAAQILYGAVTCAKCGSEVVIMENQFGHTTAAPCDYCIKYAIMTALKNIYKPAPPEMDGQGSVRP